MTTMVLLDGDGVPLPDGFQPGASLWVAVYDVMVVSHPIATAAARTNECMVAMHAILARLPNA